MGACDGRLAGGAASRQVFFGQLLFFTKGAPTKDIWFYEHPYPEGVKSYNKTKPMKIEEFEVEKSWWGVEADGFKRRKESGHAWKVGIEDVKKRGYDLDIKNPHINEQEIHDPEILLAQYAEMMSDISSLRGQIKSVLQNALQHEVE